VPAGELSCYLEEELHWPQWCSQETVAWISSWQVEAPDLKRLAQALRHHWTIENGIFYVRDVSYGEDRNHARITGPALSIICITAISLIRREGYPYMSDA
jgi:predicted transposase YbfD/YdcC